MAWSRADPSGRLSCARHAAPCDSWLLPSAESGRGLHHTLTQLLAPSQSWRLGDLSSIEPTSGSTAKQES